MSMDDIPEELRDMVSAPKVVYGSVGVVVGGGDCVRPTPVLFQFFAHPSLRYEQLIPLVHVVLDLMREISQ